MKKYFFWGAIGFLVGIFFSLYKFGATFCVVGDSCGFIKRIMISAVSMFSYGDPTIFLALAVYTLVFIFAGMLIGWVISKFRRVDNSTSI